MGTETIYDRLREISWRRKLSVAEERELHEWLAAHPEVHESLELDAGLTEVLRKLPNVPLSSNFTARVLKAVEVEAMADARERSIVWKFWRRLPRWLPRVASATIVVTATASVYLYHSSVEATQKDLVQRMAKFPLPSPEILTNFDAIRIVSATPAPDEQLLALFQ